MIEVKNLVKDYGGHMAVDHLNFTIEDGQIYGFLGPNGAGKSTTMNMMTGYIGATAGEVLINGHNILEEPEVAKQYIGYLPELPPLYTDMTVGEQLEFAAELKKIPKKERKAAIDEVVELAKLEDVKGRLIKNLSKGYKQRVGLAQAVIGMPPVIILDEPTVGLDPKQMIEIRDTIRALGQNHTVILSSHILSEVSAVCDYIMIIDHGRLIASDTPENLERQLAGATGMELLVKGETEDISGILGEMTEIENVQIEDTPEEGVRKLSFTLVPEQEDVREMIFFAFADRRLPILSMKTTKASLEEVFLELTKDDVELSPEDDAEPLLETDAEISLETDGNLSEAADETGEEEEEHHESDL